MSDKTFFENDTAAAERTGLKEPEMYRVILLNDHYTTMDFVVKVIKVVFHKSVVDATRIMMDVHKKGKGAVGMYPYDIARTKIAKVKELARKEEFPLECNMERV